MGLDLALRRFRSGMAVVMVLVIGVASFAVVMHRAELAAPVHTSSASLIPSAPASPAKPCQRRVPPGTVNTCPLSTFSIAAVLGDDAALNAPTALSAWSLTDSSRLAPVAGLGLYRPPRFGV